MYKNKCKKSVYKKGKREMREKKILKKVNNLSRDTNELKKREEKKSRIRQHLQSKFRCILK